MYWPSYPPALRVDRARRVIHEAEHICSTWGLPPDWYEEARAAQEQALKVIIANGEDYNET